MGGSIEKVVQDRRSWYAINDQSPVTDEQIRGIVDFALLHVPSAFNSQSTRLVLLLKEHHKKFWDIVMNALRAVVPPEKFAPSEQKINSFAAGYGTILYYEDQKVVEDLQSRFPGYAKNFPAWSQQTSAMHQIVIWMMLEDAGLGASLQHYNPLVDEETRRVWSLDPAWTLVGQMPFGGRVKAPDAKEFHSPDERRKFFG
ncbi:MAG: nitroreductase family protein [Synergistaceae bacterium]|jgi:predicted oxidoreductase (fatty acid repression mutant protein)|nr:nitroreductase family protein [Synergistaceae bacterium]